MTLFRAPAVVVASGRRRYVAWWRQGTPILDIAEHIRFSPCLLARVLIAELQNWPKPQVAKAIKDPTIITDPRLQAEVHGTARAGG